MAVVAVVAVEELKGWCFLCLCNNFESCGDDCVRRVFIFREF
jgi:hypothetical protein